MISEFYPCALAGDEYFSVSCSGALYLSLRDWSVTDGEGEIRFVSDIWLFPGKTFTVSFNASSYWDAYDRLPDLSLDSPQIGDHVVMKGSFRLADVGDSIVLRSPDGATVDMVMYGSVDEVGVGWSGPPMPSLRKGEVAKRLKVNGGPVDTDTAADWLPFREFRYGFTEFGSRSFDVAPGAVTAFTSPDCSLQVITGAIRDSRRMICICTYEFSSVPICLELLEAVGRGVRVRVLVDGAPAGDMDEEAVACLSAIRASGAEVLTLNGNLTKGIVQHVGALHAKYIVIDSSKSIVMSENLVEDGVPQDSIFGNRGWGAMISDAGLAGYLLDLFDADARRSRHDVRDWLHDSRYNASAVLRKPPGSSHPQGFLASFVSTERASVTVVPSPDGSVDHPYLLEFLHASESVAVEQFQVDLFWTSRWTGERYLNPLLRDLLDSADGGAEVKALFDSSWFNYERNAQAVDFLRGNSTSGSRLSSDLIDRRSPISLLHNKGAVVDGTLSSITSNNWVSASFARNRELAVLIGSREIASHFLRAFDLDWLPDDSPPVCDAGEDLELTQGRSVVLDASGCYDDRQICEYSWDFDADGHFESRDVRALYNGTVPGKHIVSLRVTDAWGNSAVDEVSVTVVSPESSDHESSVVGIPQFLWPIPLLLAGCLAAAGLIRRRRNPPDVRNLNHRPRS